MKNKQKQILKNRHEEFQDYLNQLYSYMESNHPGWQDDEDTKNVKYIKRRLRDTAKIWQKNRHKKKQKVLHKKDYPEIWPFTVESIIIVQTSKLMISCIINFQEYALNGLAVTGLKLKSPHAAGLADKIIPSEFIKIGREL